MAAPVYKSLSTETLKLSVSFSPCSRWRIYWRARRWATWRHHVVTWRHWWACRFLLRYCWGVQWIQGHRPFPGTTSIDSGVSSPCSVIALWWRGWLRARSLNARSFLRLLVSAYTFVFSSFFLSFLCSWIKKTNRQKNNHSNRNHCRYHHFKNYLCNR